MSELEELSQQLAASQATNEKLRGVLKTVHECYFKTETHETLCERALAIPNDTTALNKLLAAVYEECAETLEQQHTWITNVAAATTIRALAKKHVKTTTINSDLIEDAIDIIRKEGGYV